MDTQHRSSLDTPTWAAIAGLSYGAIMIAVLLLRNSSLPSAPTVGESVNASGLQAASTATALVPFAGIAFLWFIGVLRSEIGKREDQFFATVMMGSGLLYVAMSFVAAAASGAMLTLINAGFPETDHAIASLQMVSVTLSADFGARMAAVFVLSVTTIGRKTALQSTTLVVIGYLVALMLLFSPPLTRDTQMLFPIWVIMLSVLILIRARRRPTGT